MEAGKIERCGEGGKWEKDWLNGGVETNEWAFFVTSLPTD